MASITKSTTGNGEVRYRVFIRLRGLKPITRTFRDVKIAKTWAKKTEAEFEIGGVLPDLESHRRTLKELIQDYLAESTHRDHSTLQRLNWWRAHHGNLTLNRITRKTVKDALGDLATAGPKGKPLAGASLNRYQAALSGAFKWAVEEGWVSRNPATGIRRAKETDGFGQWLETPDDRRKLLDACAASDWAGLRVIVFLALITGARKGELSGLRWPDVSLDRGTALARDTKNGSDNLMALPPAAVTLLRTWKLQCGSTMFVFPNPTDPKRNYYHWAHHWNAARETAGFPTLRFHSLRHSAASMAVENGASDRQVAELLNHRTLAMVKRYSHVRDAVTRKISEQIAAGLV